MLNVGDKAPEFRVKTDEGKDISLSDFRGKRVLLFFFPKANTSG
jgi:peroxiredoxin Q/BCP